MDWVTLNRPIARASHRRSPHGPQRWLRHQPFDHRIADTVESAYFGFSSDDFVPPHFAVMTTKPRNSAGNSSDIETLSRKTDTATRR